AGILANPFHFLTLFFSFLMLLLPLVSVSHFVWLDAFICAAIAASMFVLGTRLAVAQGLMLLMSYSGLPSSGDHSATANRKMMHAPEKKTGGYSVANNSRADHSTVSSVLREIESEPQVARV